MTVSDTMNPEGGSKKSRYCEKGLSTPQYLVYSGSKPSMNKHYRLPLRTQPKTVSTTVRRRRGLPSLVTTSLFALGGIAALFVAGFAAFFAYKHFSHKAVHVVAVAPSPSASPTTPAVVATDVLRPLADPNHASSPVPSPTVAVVPQGGLTSAAAPTPGASVTQSAEKGGASADNPAKTTSKAARKSLEKKRQAAERKRARLEQMYQNHEISTTEYNKGEQEYKDEILKYRKEANPGT